MLGVLLFAQLGLAQLPPPYVVHCARTQDIACRVERVSLEDLASLHRLVSELIATDEDERPDDPWEVFPASGKGDCDDQALSERAALVAFGMDPKALSIETGKVTEADGRVVGHVVLIVELDGKRWVLDRKVPQGVYEDGKRPYAWTQSARQSHEGILWHAGE